MLENHQLSLFLVTFGIVQIEHPLEHPLLLTVKIMQQVEWKTVNSIREGHSSPPKLAEIAETLENNMTCPGPSSNMSHRCFCFQ